MNIAILGTRGIPNNYGGFEQFAEYLSVGLVDRGHQVTVYSPHFHPYQEKNFRGVTIQHVYSPEHLIGAAANFTYDFQCMQHALKQGFDVLLECGYHSNAPSYYLMKGRKKPVLITNMDGLEWKRSKWNKFTRWLILQLEKVAVKKSHILVSDNKGIQDYYKRAYNAESVCIPYGADLIHDFKEETLSAYKLQKEQYYLLIARLEPENNIETILDGYALATSEMPPMLVVGNHETAYGVYLKKKYADYKNIRFLGAIYDFSQLNDLRCYAKAYFHGHSVGGTNPSLLEAMASNAPIVAHDNIFNQSVLKEDAYYFTTKETIRDFLLSPTDKAFTQQAIRNNRSKIEHEYTWNAIIDQYEALFTQ